MKRIQLISKRNIVAIMLLCVATSANAKWNPLAEISTFGQGRWGTQIFTVDNKIYIGGGYIGNFQNVNDLQSYDPATQTWKFLNSLPGTNATRTGGMTFTINGKAYLAMGCENYNSFSPTPTYLKDLWEYNHASDTWTKKADFPDSGRADAAVFVLNNKAYIVGGQTSGSGSTFSSDLWEYDPATNKWTEKKKFPEGGIFHSAGFASGNKGYVVGGRITGASTNKVFEYNPSTNSWVEKAAYPEDNLRGGTAFVIGGKAYVGMGIVNEAGGTNKYMDYFFSYDPATNKWSYWPGGEVPAQGRTYGISTVVNNKAYFGGGWRLDGSTQTFFRDFYEIDPTAVVGINNTNAPKNIVVYPNPATENLYIDGTHNGQSFTMTDITGKMIKNGVINGNSINISELAPGAYTLHISTANGAAGSMIIKQ